MINLRYHIVSLTAVFLAIGIGLTLGSTFLDRATVENLNGQLASLEERLGERDEQIGELETELEHAQSLQEALDEQGPALLADRLDSVPVVVVASEGVDEADVDGAIRSLDVAGADVQGLWWLQDRFLLAGDGDVADLATALDESSNDPARLRRVAVAALGDALRERQLDDAGIPGAEGPDAGDPDAPQDPAAGEGEATGGPVAGEADPGAGDPASGVAGDESDVAAGDEEATAELATLEELPAVQALIDAGFIRFEPVDDGPDAPLLPSGVRVLVVGGSPVVPDDVVVGPLLARMTRDLDSPAGTVVSSALGDEEQVSEIVAAVRDDERLRGVVSTVDDLEHFQGWMATVLAIDDLGDDVVGHYGLGEGASSLLPPLRAP